MFLCGNFDGADLITWERKPSAQKMLNNAKAIFVEKCKEKMAYNYKKPMVRQLWYMNQVKELPKVEEVLEKMAEASMEDRQYFNAVVESNSKPLEKLMVAMLKQSEQMMALMLNMKNGMIGGGNLNAVKKQDKEEKCLNCHRKKHPGGASECQVDPKNTDNQQQ